MNDLLTSTTERELDMWTDWLYHYVLLSSGSYIHIRGSSYGPSFRPPSETRFYSVRSILLEPEAVGIVGNRSRPVCEDLCGSDLLCDSIDDLVLISVVFDQLLNTRVVVSATSDRKRT